MENVFVIIPTFNDYEKLYQNCSVLIDKGVECVVVNDASEKNIKSSLTTLKVHYLEHQQNLGQGAAIQTGTVYALSKGAKTIAHFDADGQHQVEDLLTMLGMLNLHQVDVVLGSRFLKNDDKDMHIPYSRKKLLQWAIYVNNMITGVKLSDAHNGLRVLTRSAAICVEIQQNRMAHATEIIQKIKWHQLRYMECSTEIIYEKESYKAKRLGYIINILWDLFYVYIHKYFMLLILFISLSNWGLLKILLHLNDVILSLPCIILFTCGKYYVHFKKKLDYKTMCIRKKAIEKASLS